jgi:hypothetical protein
MMSASRRPPCDLAGTRFEKENKGSPVFPLMLCGQSRQLTASSMTRFLFF